MLHGTCSTGNGDSISSTAETESLDYLPDDVGFASTVFEPLQRDCGLLMQYQDMINRTALCLVRFREATREVELLRQENAGLRSLNRELSNHVIKKQYEEYYFNTGPPPQFDIASGLRKFCNLYEDDDGGDENDGGYGESPTSVMEESIGVDKDERVSLPKSISVRSSGYLKTSQSTSTASLGKVTRQLTSNGPQRVYIRGRNKEEDEEPLELEVYNQGMFKTELCNKWQETGACPYGDNCQFAHGIKELRPVIRHPRYKTEVCRMILSGDICPYGHRCHFRHDLTDLASRSGRHVKPGAVKFSSEVK